MIDLQSMDTIKPLENLRDIWLQIYWLMSSCVSMKPGAAVQVHHAAQAINGISTDH